jgi:hypothetical protein
MGKSSIVASIADEFNLKLIDHRLSTSPPEDLSGLPRFDADGRARMAPFADIFPLEGEPLPEGKVGWLLFLDEINAASKATQAASYKLILDKMIGQFHLHSHVAIVAAGNLNTDRAITVELSTAMQSRMAHIEMTLDFDQWYIDVALKQNYDERITAYLKYKPEHLMDFRPDHQEKTFACPRTWEFVNKLLKSEGAGVPISDEDISLYAGIITPGITVSFVQFSKVFQQMVTQKEIIADPTGIPVPNDTPTRWAVISHMISHADEQNVVPFGTYASRFDISFRILFFRAIMEAKPHLGRDPSVIAAQVELSKFLNS